LFKEFQRNGLNIYFCFLNNLIRLIEHGVKILLATLSDCMQLIRTGNSDEIGERGTRLIDRRTDQTFYKRYNSVHWLYEITHGAGIIPRTYAGLRLLGKPRNGTFLMPWVRSVCAHSKAHSRTTE